MNIGVSGKNGKCEYFPNNAYPYMMEVPQKSSITFNNSFTSGIKQPVGEIHSMNGSLVHTPVRGPKNGMEGPIGLQNSMVQVPQIYQSPIQKVEPSRQNLCFERSFNIPLDQQCIMLRRDKSQLLDQLRRAQGELESRDFLLMGKQKEIEELRAHEQALLKKQQQNAAFSQQKMSQQKLFFQVMDLQFDLEKMQKKYDQLQRQHQALNYRYQQVSMRTNDGPPNDHLRAEMQNQISSLKQKIRVLEQNQKNSNQSTVFDTSYQSFYQPLQGSKSNPHLEQQSKMEISKLLGQIRQKNQMIRYLQLQCLKGNRVGSDQQISQLNCINQQLQRQNQHLKQSIQEVTVHNQNLLASLQKMEIDKQKLSENVNQLSNVADRYAEREAQSGAQIAKLQEQIRDIYMVNQRQNNELKQTIHDYEKLIKQAQEKMETQVKGKQALQKQFQCQKQELQKKQNYFNEQIKQKESQIDTLLEKINTYESDYVQLTEEIKNVKNVISQIEGELENAKNKEKTLIKQKEIQQIKITSLENQLQLSKTQLIKFEKVQEQIENIKVQNEELKKLNKDLLNKLQNVQLMSQKQISSNQVQTQKQIVEIGSQTQIVQVDTVEKIVIVQKETDQSLDNQQQQQNKQQSEKVISQNGCQENEKKDGDENTQQKYQQTSLKDIVTELELKLSESKTLNEKLKEKIFTLESELEEKGQQAQKSVFYQLQLISAQTESMTQTEEIKILRKIIEERDSFISQQRDILVDKDIETDRMKRELTELKKELEETSLKVGDIGEKVYSEQEQDDETPVMPEQFQPDFIEIDKNALLHICDILGLSAIPGQILKQIIDYLEQKQFHRIQEFYKQVLQLFEIQGEIGEETHFILIQQAKEYKQIVDTLMEKSLLQEKKIDSIHKDMRALHKDLSVKEKQNKVLQTLVTDLNQQIVIGYMKRLSSHYNKLNSEEQLELSKENIVCVFQEQNNIQQSQNEIEENVSIVKNSSSESIEEPQKQLSESENKDCFENDQEQLSNIPPEEDMSNGKNDENECQMEQLHTETKDSEEEDIHSQ